MIGYFSQIRMRPGHGPNALLARCLTEGYGLHQSLWQLFSEQGDETRDFLYRQVEGHGTPVIYVVSQRPPLADDPFWVVETKPYDPQVQQGSTFAFSLRANATRSTRDPATGKEHRHDAILHAQKKQEGAPAGQNLQDAGRAWLEERAEAGGFTLGPLRVDRHEEHCLFVKGKPPIRFSTVDFEGLLSVTDPTRFRHTLFHGLGRSKGFGCGLLLIRRV